MPAGISVFPGQSNTYVKDFRSSGKLQVSFSRNPRDFALANYVQYVPVKRDQGYYRWSISVGSGSIPIPPRSLRSKVGPRFLNHFALNCLGIAVWGLFHFQRTS